MRLEPSEQRVERCVNAAAVTEPIRRDGHELDSGLDAGHVAKQELAGVLPGGAQVVRDALRRLFLLGDQDLFEFGLLAAVRRAEVFVVEDVACARRHRLDVSRDDLVQVFEVLNAE